MVHAHPVVKVVVQVAAVQQTMSQRKTTRVLWQVPHKLQIKINQPIIFP